MSPFTVKRVFCFYLQDSIICATYVLAQYLKEINFRKKVYVVGAAAIAQEMQKAGIRCIGVGVSECASVLMSLVLS